MLNVLILGLLFVYYWYFYTSYSKPVPKPSTGAPLKAESMQPEFDMHYKYQFDIKIGGKLNWHHELPREHYVFSNQKVIPKDVCFGMQDGFEVEASGQHLYHYLKNRPDTSLNRLDFHENVTPYTVQTGKVYYFTCMNSRIERLNICPSGQIFRNNHCLNINMCTGKPNGTKFAGSDITSYFECRNGRETKVKYCDLKQFFYHDRCVQMDDLAHRCKFFSNIPLLLDEKIRIECRDGKPVRFECAPGYRFFDRDYCESDRCVGKPDHTRLGMPLRNIEPFHFTPGYWECSGGRIWRTVECPQTWDDSLSVGGNLTFLPMVFDGRECSVPEFGRNVFSQDPDVLVPMYDFTKHLQNWDLADAYDRAAGYDSAGRKRILPPNMRISKRFKSENACKAGTLLPVHDQPNQYYDCDQQVVIDCPKDEYFNGKECVTEPLFAFKFKGIPIFSFDSLDYSKWIRTFDYLPENLKLNPRGCTAPESKFNQLYNICSHPDCVPYEFLSMIPDLGMFLPTDKHARCRFDEASRRLVKQEVNFPYSFWSQKPTAGNDDCTPGKRLSTGNFIWDSTVFATCEPDRPFIFCPSVHSFQLIARFNDVYACAPPAENTVTFKGKDWTQFDRNELRLILPDQWTGKPEDVVKLNKADKQFRELPEYGIKIPADMRINLLTLQPVQLVYRFRVTHPPNVVFEYQENGDISPDIGADNSGYLVKNRAFTRNQLAFPRYNIEKHVEFMRGPHLV